ncbi:MAG TPA: deoxyguanosinetriphosphate triphosphohydrolase [Planctomycetota bacterium]|nr:deoxyguanosinetriphosphate triphosphohydrolase [Planctomycetota bacterium]
MRALLAVLAAAHHTLVPAMSRHHPLFDRRAKEAREERDLAPYALHSVRSRGRSFHEEDDDLRTCWERDRDRIVHCTGFRRLMYKTQVFVNSEGDHFRTRMSHSLEVAQVARSVGNALALNEPFCEALALCHDIGHPPFGHRGEAALDELMRDHGGFRHNFQVLRVVDRLERRSPEYPGLNLTREIRESLLKHEKDADWPAEFRPRPSRPYLEAQVVDLADSTAYLMHDLEDGLAAKMFSEAVLAEEVELWRGASESVELRHPGFLTATSDTKLRVKRVTNELLKIAINDLIETTSQRLERLDLRDAQAARNHDALIVDHSEAIGAEVADLTKFLYRRFYHHPHLQELTAHAQQILAALFAAYVAAPKEMAPWYQQWIERAGLERAVCDYLAGMTDRFAEQEFARLKGS